MKHNRTIVTMERNQTSPTKRNQTLS